MKKFNVLIIGSGGREHAMAWKIAQSPLLNKLYVAPGNAGIAAIADDVDIEVNDFEGIAKFCLENVIDILVPGPELPLVNGIRDYFDKDPKLQDVAVIGPDRQGAMLEGSKDYSKQFMIKHNIPTAKASTFTAANYYDGVAFLKTIKPPYVLKADGLAAGKGVIITSDLDQAHLTLKDMLVDKKFGQASSKVLIEEFLTGIELSVFILTDGQNYYLLPEAKDYKRVGENDTGPNTGGMGCVSPVPFFKDEFKNKVINSIIEPTLKGLKTDGINYKGFIFFGLIKVENEPYVIEYNVRMGDPETQIVMPRAKFDLLEALNNTAQGIGQNVEVPSDTKHGVGVVLCSGGYPEKYEKGLPIKGLKQLDGVVPFHAGTKHNQNGNLVTNGGRVIVISGLDDSIIKARHKVLTEASKITWDGCFYRTDIGFDLI